ncbi:MAG: IS630 family transposase, partial [Candidatus Nomurabacteria bacterium]|nr:IS630 family transposase [Candidatus Nomurabacteria bacterium]
MNNFLTSEQVHVLKQAHKTIKEKRLADRIKAVLMLHFGFTYDQISQALLLDEVTIRRHVDKFKKEGLNGLLECKYQGGQTNLSSFQETELRKYLQTNTKRTSLEISLHIQKTYQVSFTVGGVIKLLHRLGFTY